MGMVWDGGSSEKSRSDTRIRQPSFSRNVGFKNPTYAALFGISKLRRVTTAVPSD